MIEMKYKRDEHLGLVMEDDIIKPEKKHHFLKQDDRFFQSVVDGKKSFEVRYNDRDYKIGDTITLREGYLEDGVFLYTGRAISAEISHIETFGLQDGYVLLSLSKVGLLVI